MLINMLLEIQTSNCIILIFFLNHSNPEMKHYREEREAELGIKDVVYMVFAKNMW